MAIGYIFPFRRRLRRRDLILRYLIFLVPVIVIRFYSYSERLELTALEAISFLAYLPLLFVVIASVVGRLKDMDKSPWWILLAFVPFFNFAGLIILMFAPGTLGTNRYGRDPRAPAEDAWAPTKETCRNCGTVLRGSFSKEKCPYCGISQPSMDPDSGLAAAP